MLIVAVLPSILFPPKKRSDSRTVGRRDSPAAVRPSAPGPTAVPAPLSVGPTIRRSVADTVWVTSPQYRFGFSTLGGRLVQTQLLEYKSFAPGDSGRPVQLVPADRPLLTQWLGLGADTLALAGSSFHPRERGGRAAGGSASLTLPPPRGAPRVPGRHTFRPRDHR